MCDISFTRKESEKKKLVKYINMKASTGIVQRKCGILVLILFIHVHSTINVRTLVRNLIGESD